MVQLFVCAAEHKKRHCVFLCPRNDPSRLLITLGASLTMCDTYHRNTPLHWAVYVRNSSAVSLLIKAGSDLSARNVQVCR